MIQISKMKQSMRFIFRTIAIIIFSLSAESKSQSIDSTKCDTTLCIGSNFDVNFIASGYAAGTAFTIALSDASGQFSLGSPTIGTGLTNPINCLIPANSLPGAGYRIIVIPMSNPLTADTINYDLILLNNVSFNMSIAASALNICANSNVDFTSSTTNAVDSIHYSWYLNGTNLLGETAATYSNSSLSSTSEVYLVAEAFGVCLSNNIDTTDTITVTVGTNGALPFNISAVANPSVACQGDNITLTSTTISGSGNLTYSWTYSIGNNTVIIGTTNPISSATIPAGAIVKVVVTSDAACLSNSSDSAIVNLIINTTTPPSVGINQPVRFCDNPDSYGRIVAVPFNPNNIYTWYLDGVALPPQNNPNELLIQTKNVTAGQIITCKVTSNNICSSTSTATSNQIVIDFLSTPTVKISEDFTMKFGESGKYVEVLSGELRPNSVRWISDYSGIFENASAPKTIVSPKITQKVFFYAVASNGCPVNLDLTITVVPDKNLFVPDIFSPNNDGLNDIFFIRNRANQIVESTFLLQIFDEFGEVIFESKYQNYGWDGTYRNKPCKEGAYVFKVSGMYNNSESFEKTDKIILIR